jgi:hypothetical protein
MTPATRRFYTILAICFAASLAMVVYPVYVIRPFRAQGARELAIALSVMRWRGLLTILSAIAAIVAFASYLRSPSRWWKRTLAGAATFVVALLAVAGRINVYELMFHPAGAPAFVAAVESHLDGDEKVITVRLGREARAYPVRSMSYHHVINDVLDGTPIVATY